MDFHTQLTSEAEVELIPWDADEAAWIYRHSMSHVLAQAVLRLFPNAQLAIGPAIDDGFYYDFDVAEPFTPEDLQKDRARDEASRQAKTTSSSESTLRAKKRKRWSPTLPTNRKSSPTWKRARSCPFTKTASSSTCAGGRTCSAPDKSKHFKLLSVAGAYWRGDESRKMLQRIYGTAFATREALDHHLAMLEEAKKRGPPHAGQTTGVVHL